MEIRQLGTLSCPYFIYGRYLSDVYRTKGGDILPTIKMINLITKMTFMSLGIASFCMAQDVVITQNTECDVDAGSMVTCGANGSTAENWFARNFYIDQDVTVNSVTWGSGYATTVSANIFFSIASGPGNPDGVTLTQVGTAVQPIDDSIWFDTAVDTPFEVPAGSYLVVEFQIPDTGTDQGIWPANTTTATETTYLMAADCGLTAYSDVGAIGFPDAQMIMCLNATLGDFNPCDLPLPAVCAADVDGDGTVAVSDVLEIIGQWGQCGDGTFRPSGDVAPLPNGDCCVTVADVLAVVGSWGADCTVYGACCYADGTCAQTSMDDCSGTWSEGSDCSEIACTTAACCMPDDSCSDLTADACAAMGGDSEGEGSSCAGTDCTLETPGDECSSAITVVNGANAFDTTDMTAGGTAPDDTMCEGTFLDWGESQDGWYMYVATGGLTTFDTCDASSYDTSLVLYEGSCDNQVACNGDAVDGGEGCQPYSSSIPSYECIAGETYYIRIGAWNGDGAGPGTLNINPPASGFGACCFADETCLDLDAASCAAFEGNFQGDGTSCAPDNPCLAGAGDECSSAIEAFEGANPYDTTMMTPSDPQPDDTECADTYLNWDNSPDVWMYWVAPSSGTASFSACDAASYDTSMVLYEGSCDNQVACNGDTAGEDGCQAYYSAIYDYAVTAGETYYVRMGGWQAASGPGTVTITLVGGNVVGACCMTDGSCMDMVSADCTQAGGSWSSAALCADTECPAPYSGCPAGAEDNCDPCWVDNDDSSSDCNAGLNGATGTEFQAITLGVPVCGTGSVFFDGGAQGTYRDLDWFTNDTVNAGGTFTISVGTSGMDCLFGIVDNTAGAFVEAYAMPGGYEGSVTFAEIPAGDYSILV